MTALPAFLADSPAEVPRTVDGRPRIRPLNGGNLRAYSRVTTFIKCIDDPYHLTQWKKRMVLVGAAADPSLLNRVPFADKDELNDLAEQAMETARANVKRDKGTHLHSLSEYVDRGEHLPLGTSEADRADMHAYYYATRSLRVVKIETLTVNDELRVAGTPDRIVERDGQLMIGDLKTGSIQYSELEIAMQMAIYAHSDFYDPLTGTRAPTGVSQETAIIFHLPSGSGECRLYDVDLVKGWEAVLVAREIRRTRNTKDLFTPSGGAS